MDRVDRDILRLLEKDGRIPYTELAERIGLSPNATSERVRRLKARGFIRGIVAQIDPAALGLSLSALIEVKMESTTTATQFEARAAATPGVIRALTTTGRYDWLLEVIARDQADLHRIIEALRAGGLTRDTNSRVVVADRRYALAR